MKLSLLLLFLQLWGNMELSLSQNDFCQVGKMHPRLFVAGLPPSNETIIPGHKLQFQCSNDLYLDGSEEIECLQTGQWSSPFPTCSDLTEIKCAAPVIENGFVSGDIQEYKEHEVLNFQCNPQYKRVEDRPSKCIKVGTRAEWSPTPGCEEIKCDLKLPALEGTRYEPAARSVFSPGDTLRVLCGDKHWIVNHQTTSAETTCQSDGKWSIRPLCKEVICSGQRDSNVDRWDVYWYEQKKLGDSVNYWCKYGFQNTANQATCTRDGWAPKPLCRGIYCTKPNIENAEITYNNKNRYTPRERVRYTCRNGSRNTFTITCTQSGWTGIKSCPAYCDKLNSENQSMNFTSDKDIYMNGDVIEYQCIISDAAVEGNATCVDGKWIKTLECNETCIVPRLPANLQVTQGLSGGYLTKGKTLTFGCQQRGHIIQGNATVECLASGEWSSPFPTCGAPMGCSSRPPPLADGDTKASVQFQYMHNAKVEYICQNYYIMEGEPFMTCNNGEWTGQIRCLKPCTVDKDAMRRHNIRFGYSSSDKLYSTHNDVISFACTYGTRHDGILEMVQKCIDGVMNLPTCQ